MTGTILRFHDHGTIVSLEIARTTEEAEAGHGTFVHMDHSPFRWLVDSETDGNAAELIGREITVEGTFGFDQRIYF